MPRSTSFVQDIIARQERMLRLAERDHDLTLAVLSAETSIPKPTIASWKHDVAMPAWALVCLSKHIPDDLTSLMFEPVNRFVGSCVSGDGGLDALARESAGYNVEYLNARDPEGDGGSALTPRERAILKDKSRRVAAVARCAAA